MANITIIFKDGTKREFKHEGRAGGSWTKTLRYEGEWIIVTDEWEHEHGFPAADVKEVVQTPSSRP